jgi:hypothetical protein
MRLRVLPAVLLTGLALPGAASAATITVSPGQKVADAAAAAHDGDTILLKAGIYQESVAIDAKGVTVAGEAGAALTGAPGATGSTPTLSFAATAGGAATVSSLIVVNAVTTGPAIAAGAPGLGVVGSTVVGAKGAGIAVSGAGANGAAVLRSLVYGASSALSFTSDATAAKTLTVDSSVLVGAPAGSGIAVGSNGGPGSQLTSSRPGTLTVAARHVTIDGAKTPFAADAKATTGTVAGDVAATFTDSIVLAAGASSRQLPSLGDIAGQLGQQLPGLPAPPGSGSADGAVTVATPRTLTTGNAAALFVAAAKFNYHLRADAPVIGLGGLTAGESATDLDGQPRAVNGVSDLGADQFVDTPPTAALSAPKFAREGRATTLSAAGSADPDASIGGSITAYRWDFGDGETATTSTPTAEHTYARRGSVTASVTVVDNRGGTSAAATTPVEVVDGVAPTLAVGSPRSAQRIALRKGSKRQQIVFFGTAADDTGVAAVTLALRLTKRAADGRCYWYDGKGAFKARSCALPTPLVPKLSGSAWAYTLPASAKLKAGGYELLGAAIDKTGLIGTGVAVPFTLR